MTNFWNKYALKFDKKSVLKFAKKLLSLGGGFFENPHGF